MAFAVEEQSHTKLKWQKGLRKNSTELFCKSDIKRPHFIGKTGGIGKKVYKGCESKQ